MTVLALVLTAAACRRPESGGDAPPGGEQAGSAAKPKWTVEQLELGGGERTLPLDVILDPHLTIFDAVAPKWRFDGSGGSLLPTLGWSPVSIDGECFSWAMNGKAEMTFPGPTIAVQSLFFRAWGVPAKDGKPQEMTIEINGHRLAPMTLGPSVADYRVPLPADALVEGDNHLVLSFAHATTLPGTDDPRLLSAGFHSIAVVPAHIPAPYNFIQATTFDREKSVLRLADGAEIVIPIAPQRIMTLQLGEVTASSLALEVVVETRTPIDGRVQWRETWRGPAAKLSREMMVVENRSSELGGIRFLAHSLGSGVAVEGAMVNLALGPTAFTDRAVESASASTPGRPHIFMYVVDALRGDHVDALVEGNSLTPNLAAFAKDSVVYTNAESPSSWTLPAMASVLTGVPPLLHKMMTGNIRLAWKDFNPLGLRLSADGYQTIGVSQSYVVGAAFGFPEIFDSFVESSQLGGWELRTEDIRGILRHLLFQRGGFSRPLFCYLHSVGPHSPYQPTAKFRARADANPGTLPATEYVPGRFTAEKHAENPADLEHLKSLYAGEVSYEDEGFAHFLNVLKFFGVYEDSLIVFMSDHGEEFHDHGGFDHGTSLYEELTRVPLVVHYPQGRWAGTAVKERVSTLDLVATVDEFVDGDWAGMPEVRRSFSPAALGSASPEAAVAFAEVHKTGSAADGAIAYRAVWDRDLKCLFSESGIDQFGNQLPYLTVYDLTADPNEKTGQTPGDGRDLRCWTLLGEWVDHWTLLSGAATSEKGPSAVGEDVRSQLRALGYMQ